VWAPPACPLRNQACAKCKGCALQADLDAILPPPRHPTAVVARHHTCWVYCLFCVRFGTAPATSVSCSGPCVAGAGRACSEGSVSPVGTLCLPGTYSAGGPRVTACTSCPASKPYTTSGATSEADCTACSAADACSSDFGKVALPPCPDLSWSVYFDRGDVEGANSCLKFFPEATTWPSAKVACEVIGERVHLLTSAQVGENLGWHGIGCVGMALCY
jgi:hypothetical protein